MSTYTITIIDDADAVLGRKWGYNAINQTVEDFNQSYLENWIQGEFNTQSSAEVTQAAQLAAIKSQTNIIVS